MSYLTQAHRNHKFLFGHDNEIIISNLRFWNSQMSSVIWCMHALNDVICLPFLNNLQTFWWAGFLIIQPVIKNKRFALSTKIPLFVLVFYRNGILPIFYKLYNICVIFLVHAARLDWLLTTDLYIYTRLRRTAFGVAVVFFDVERAAFLR